MKPFKRMSRCFILPALSLLVSGCGFLGSPSAADPDQAQHALDTALQAWKAGDTPEQLAQRAPSIRISDWDWSRGLKLVNYKAGETGKLVGYDMNYPVQLELKDRKGKPFKKTAVYVITTHPEILVLRQEG